jgi:hypothetical protein
VLDPLPGHYLILVMNRSRAVVVVLLALLGLTGSVLSRQDARTAEPLGTASYADLQAFIQDYAYVVAVLYVDILSPARHMVLEDRKSALNLHTQFNRRFLTEHLAPAPPPTLNLLHGAIL